MRLALVMSVEVTMRAGRGSPAAWMRISARRRVQEVTMVQRSGGRLASRSDRAGQGDDACEIGDFAALDFAILSVVIGVGQIVAHRGETRAAVGASDNFFGIESVLKSPLMPDALDGRRGVDEHSVEVKE